MSQSGRENGTAGHKSTRERLDLDTTEGLGALCDAIIKEKGVARACKALGLDRKTVWLYLARHPEAQAAAWLARQECAHALFDECCEIADNAKREDWAIARLRIETRMRAAGKLNQRAYGDQPRHLSQTYVAGNVEIKSDENTRQALILARQHYLGQSSPDTAKHLLAAPSASPVAIPPEPIKQTGKPICSATEPEDPLAVHMRSFEKDSSEDEHWH